MVFFFGILVAVAIWDAWLDALEGWTPTGDAADRYVKEVRSWAA